MAYADTWFEFWYPDGVIPAVADVRSGTQYGLENELTGEFVGGGGDLSDENIDQIVAGVVGAATALAVRNDNSLDTDKACFIANDTWIQSFTGLGDLTDKTLVYTLKSSKDQTDANALLKIDGTGLVVYNGSPEATQAKGSITVDDLTEGNITVRIESDRTDFNGGKYLQTVKTLDTADFTVYNQGEVVVKEGGVTQVSS